LAAAFCSAVSDGFITGLGDPTPANCEQRASV